MDFVDNLNIKWLNLVSKKNPHFVTKNILFLSNLTRLNLKFALVTEFI